MENEETTEALVLLFDKSGAVVLEAFGFKGPDCTKATKELEDALGKVHQRVLKKSFHTPVKEIKATQ